MAAFSSITMRPLCFCISDELELSLNASNVISNSDIIKMAPETTVISTLRATARYERKSIDVAGDLRR